MSSFLKVVIDPSQQNVFWREIFEVVDIFSILKKNHQVWMILQVDCRQNTLLRIIEKINKTLYSKRFVTLRICHTRPKMMCGLFSMINSGTTLIVWQPIYFAAEIAKFKFSLVKLRFYKEIHRLDTLIWKTLRFSFLFNALRSNTA